MLRLWASQTSIGPVTEATGFFLAKLLTRLCINIWSINDELFFYGRTLGFVHLSSLHLCPWISKEKHPELKRLHVCCSIWTTASCSGQFMQSAAVFHMLRLRCPSLTNAVPQTHVENNVEGKWLTHRQRLILFPQIWKHRVDRKMDEDMKQMLFFFFITSHLSSI